MTIEFRYLVRWSKAPHCQHTMLGTRTLQIRVLKHKPYLGVGFVEVDEAWSEWTDIPTVDEWPEAET